MDVKFTPQQQNAIDSRGGALIVSAAAGSGKTAVLVERVIQMITGDESIDIDNLLIVTFTNAAASEMRGKIADALIKLLAKKPTSRNLKRQLALLGSARIQTVHAFCQDIVRQNFSACGVSPNFKLIDSAQSEILRQQAIGECLDSIYENGASEEFLRFADNFCEERGDSRLQTIILEVYEKLRSHKKPQQWLLNAVEICRQGAEVEEIASLEFCAEMLQDCARKIEYHDKHLRKSYEEMQGVEDVFAKYAPAFEECLEFSERFVEAARKGWDEALFVANEFKKPRLNAVRGADSGFTDKMKYARDFYCEAIEQIRTELLAKPSAEIHAEMAICFPILQGLAQSVQAFTNEYNKLKAAQNSLDFSDLEHLALSILEDQTTGEKTPYADELGAEFAEILIDEFQDTNEIQDCIFNALKQESSGIFMVGDVKQSIYRFRLAEPSIFVDKYYSYDDYEQNPHSNKRQISLNRNFRSREEVLDLTNFCFSRIMSREFGALDYNENEYLYTGATYEGTCPAEVYILETKHDDDTDLGRVEYEAEFVANAIARQLRETQVTDDETHELRTARSEDIVILLSSCASKAPIYQNALQKIGIACEGAYSGNMYNSLEISVVRSVLAVIDNPRQDVALLSVLRSPLYFFSPDELLEMRAKNKRCDFYEVLCASETEHARKFLEDLAVWRAHAADYSVSALLELIYESTNAFGIFAALDGGDARRRNLEELFFLAIGYEKNGSRGLFGFLKYLERRAQEGDSAPEGSANAVRIMSIHKSKGLEFPIVVLPDLSKRFNTDDLKGALLMHKDIGIGIRIRDLERATESKTQLQSAIMAKHRRQAREEEMRKLYVAMTRAKEKLIMTVALAKAEEKLNKWGMMIEDGKISPEAVALQGSAAMMICAPILMHPDCADLREQCGIANMIIPSKAAGKLHCEIVGYAAQENGEQEGRIVNAAPMEQLTLDMDKWRSIQNHEYAHAAAIGLPSKLTPSGLRAMDADSARLDASDDAPIIRMFYGDGDRASLGTIVHTCMQKCDYAKCASELGAAEELDRLVVQGEISADARARIEPRFISNFCASELGKIASGSECLREYQFSALVAAGEILENAPMDEEILMNGTIDLLIKTQNGAIIVDFKSDAVRVGAEMQAAQKYKSQLGIYANAAAKVLEIAVARRVVCFLATGACVEV